MLTRRTTLPTLCLALMAALASLLASPAPAGASSIIVCRGFTSCQAAGYGNAGYSAVYRQMFWRMYSGHNCTNYMAYRMIRAGMSSTRPWSGSGDARNWGLVFASSTNQTPVVGSVAWWSLNHVAYVERVIDANTILISEDHYGGDFDWRRVVRSGGGWPTGFIHLRDVPVKPVVAPVVSGVAQVGQTLTTSTGTWSPSPAAYAFRWIANGVDIPGATGRSLVLGAAQLGKVISVRVSAGRTAYATNNTTVTAATVAPGVMAMTKAPTIAGTPKVGAVLTATQGAWNPAPAHTTFSWLADGVPIPGGTGPKLQLGPDQLDKKITVVGTARRAGYTTTSATSEATDPVGPEKLTMTTPPKLTGTARPGGVLEVTAAAVSPTPTVQYQWFRDGQPVSGATAARYPVTGADLGHVLSVTVDYTRPGYTTIEKTLRAPIRTRSIPVIRVRTGRPGNVVVLLRAAGLDPVPAWVRISEGSNVTSWHKVRGSGVFSPSWLAPGTHHLTVTVRRSAWLEAATTTVTITVP